MSSKRVRLEDVAAEVGLSPASVSLVLRGVAGPSAETRERVLAAATRLGYRADRTASLLARRRTHLLGVPVALRDAFRAELAEELQLAADAAGYAVALSALTARARRGPRRGGPAGPAVRGAGAALTLAAPRPRSPSWVPACRWPSSGAAPARRVRRGAGGRRRRASRPPSSTSSGSATGGSCTSTAAPNRWRPTAGRGSSPRRRACPPASCPAGPTRPRAPPRPRAAGRPPDRGRHRQRPERDRPARRVRPGGGAGARGRLRRGLRRQLLARLAHIDLTTVSQEAPAQAARAVAAALERLDGGRVEPTESVLPPRLVVRGTTAPPPR